MDKNEKPQGKLRTGFTTGTCATASSKAAALAIINQKTISSLDDLLQKLVMNLVVISMMRHIIEKNQYHKNQLTSFFMED